MIVQKAKLHMKQTVDEVRSAAIKELDPIHCQRALEKVMFPDIEVVTTRIVSGK